MVIRPNVTPIDKNKHKNAIIRAKLSMFFCMSKIKCAVIGVGYLGRFHAQKYNFIT